MAILPADSSKADKAVVGFLAPALQAGGTVVAAGRLDSWKEVATYLRRDVRTVQLWEKTEGLPIHRHVHKKLGSVFAFRSEIDRWLQASSQQCAGALSDIPMGVVPPQSSSFRPVRRVMIAVLPFESLSGDPAHEFFSDGVTSEIITSLGRLNSEHIGIISRTSVMAYKKSGTPIGVIGKDLNVTHVLEGSTRIENGKIRINVALIWIRNQTSVWAQGYDGDAGDPIRAQKEIADQIACSLSIQTFTAAPAPQGISGLSQPASREAYLRGRYFWNQRNEDGIRKAVQCFESAIRDEPLYALGYSGLADSLTLLSFYELATPASTMPSARRAALKAIELDPHSAEAHASMADISLHFDRDWTRADQEYQAAIRCNPGYALGYHWYSNLLVAKGQHDAARLSIMHALEIDPLCLITIVWAGVTSYFARRYDVAIQYYGRALELNPDFMCAHMYLAQSLEQQGYLEEALQRFGIALQLSGGSNSVKAMKAHTFAKMGNRDSAISILAELCGIPYQQCVPSYDIAAVYAALGEPDDAVTWLRQACSERSMKVFTLAQDPRFDSLRDNREFQKVIEHVGLNGPLPDAGSLSRFGSRS
jgi:TolB-like protein/Tfp pilus assembly protein PilF